MKLPNVDRAIVDEEKILKYILDPLHRRGQHYAELFRRLRGWSPVVAGVIDCFAICRL